MFVTEQLARHFGVTLHWRANAKACVEMAVLLVLLCVTWIGIVLVEVGKVQPDVSILLLFVFFFSYTITFLTFLLIE
jgi:hypothetical protein